MRRGSTVHWILGAGLTAAALLCTPSVWALSPTVPRAPASNITLENGQVELRKNKSTRLQMYLPNSGALAGGSSTAVLAAAFSMKKAGTSLTLKSGYHARNNKAIRGYMASHGPLAQGGRGTLSAHWANERDLYNDIRRSSFDTMPSLELESLHELGLSKTLANGLSIGVHARSKNNQQTLTTQLGYTRGSLRYSATLTKSMLGGEGMHGNQNIAFALGDVQVNGGMVMRTALNGALETFPHASAQMTIKGIALNVAFKRDPKQSIAGQPIESTQLTLEKRFLKDRLALNSNVIMRGAVGEEALTSAQIGLRYSKEAAKFERLSWSVSASSQRLQGGERGTAFTNLNFSDGGALASTISTVGADMAYQLTPKTRLGVKGAARHMTGTLGAFSRVTVSTFVTHGLWDFEAMAGLNRARDNAEAMLGAQGGLHHRFAQKAFGQFSAQRALFSIKAKYSY